uniref:CorA family divalent cation transporter n=1 Tax=Candidatus Cryptobacteroides bacterium TaxID=3085639 RepID=UPI004029B30E
MHQDQGIELYGMIRQNLDIDSYVEELKDEIEKLHDTISFKVERSRNEKAETLNFMAAILLPVSIVTGFWSMNMSLFCNFKSNWLSFAIAVGLMILGLAFSIFLIRRRPLKNKRRGR